jgi:hypothetical protein
MVEGFDKIIVGAGIEPRDTIMDGRPCGDHQDRSWRSGGPQLLDDVQTIAIREAEIDDEKIIGGCGHHIAKLAGARNGVERIAIVAQRFSEKLSQSNTVFEKEKACGWPVMDRREPFYGFDGQIR